jgi:hypothetical protein
MWRSSIRSADDARQSFVATSRGVMATVTANMSMSLDGFVADSSDGTDRVFGWYGTLSDASGAYLQVKNPPDVFDVVVVGVPDVRFTERSVGS